MWVEQTTGDGTTDVAKYNIDTCANFVNGLVNFTQKTSHEMDKFSARQISVCVSSSTSCVWNSTFHNFHSFSNIDCVFVEFVPVTREIVIVEFTKTTVINFGTTQKQESWKETRIFVNKCDNVVGRFLFFFVLLFSFLFVSIENNSNRHSSFFSILFILHISGFTYFLGKWRTPTCIMSNDMDKTVHNSAKAK